MFLATELSSCALFAKLPPNLLDTFSVFEFRTEIKILCGVFGHASGGDLQGRLNPRFGYKK